MFPKLYQGLAVRHEPRIAVWIAHHVSRATRRDACLRVLIVRVLRHDCQAAPRQHAHVRPVRGHRGDHDFAVWRVTERRSQGDSGAVRRPGRLDPRLRFRVPQPGRRLPDQFAATIHNA